MTGSAKTLHSRTSDFTTLTSHNFKSTNDIALKFLDAIEQYTKICGVIFKLVPCIKLNLHCVKLKTLDVREWRVFAEPVTYYDCPCYC